MLRSVGLIEEMSRRLAVPNLRVRSFGPLGLNSCTLILKICELLVVVPAASIWSRSGRS